jgi:hypothetical protein
MAANDKRRQKKLERRNAQRKQRQRELVKGRNRALSDRLKSAAGAPILDSFISEGFWDGGTGQAVLSRQLPTGEVAFAALLIDRYCLGVKDAFGDIRTRGEYRELVEHIEENSKLVKMPPADLRCLVEEAIEYARDLGFEPHSDYRRVQPIFGDIDVQEATEHFEFGSDGKPLFMAGPYDDRQRCERILSILEDRCGKDGFHYMMAVSGRTLVEISDGSGGRRLARLDDSGDMELVDDSDDD